eukprot:175285-Pelagomonas_calceolata.AAC.2
MDHEQTKIGRGHGPRKAQVQPTPEASDSLAVRRQSVEGTFEGGFLEIHPIFGRTSASHSHTHTHACMQHN